jgi:hypothetical protein
LWQKEGRIGDILPSARTLMLLQRPVRVWWQAWAGRKERLIGEGVWFCRFWIEHE